MIRNHSAPRVVLMASVVGALGLTACNPAADGGTCAENTYEDMGNLEPGVLGLTVDTQGLPVPGVRIYIPGTSVDLYSDANGRFSIATTELNGKTSGKLYTEHDGYPDKVLEFEAPSDHVADLLIMLKPYTNSDVFNAEEGGQISDGQSTVTFRPGALMDAETGALVNGPVQISMLTYRPYDTFDMRAAPGSLIGNYAEFDQDGNTLLDGDGNPRMTSGMITSTGMLDVLMMQDGRKLELRPGMPAHVLMENIVEGSYDQDAIDRLKDERQHEWSDSLLPTITLWHFNYDSAQWDEVPEYDWLIEGGSKDGFISASAEVPEFSPANKDSVVAQWEEVVPPVVTCVCKNVKHANGSENVRGSDISLTSRAYSYRYLVTEWNDGSVDRVLIAKTLETSFSRTNTNQQGNFCGNAIVDPYSLSGSVQIDSTKTYWPGRLDDEDRQYQDVENDGLDDNADGEVDPENIVGYLGDTHYDQWTLGLSGTRACGAPEAPSIEVECINEPTDPVTGQQPQ